MLVIPDDIGHHNRVCALMMEAWEASIMQMQHQGVLVLGQTWPLKTLGCCRCHVAIWTPLHRSHDRTDYGCTLPCSPSAWSGSKHVTTPLEGNRC